MKAIIIWSTIDRLDWLNNCLKSFNGYNKYPILILMINNGLGRFGDIKREVEKLNYDEFIILQDSMEVKNPTYLIYVLNNMKVNQYHYVLLLLNLVIFMASF